MSTIFSKIISDEIVPFVADMIGFMPKKLLQRKLSLGIMTVIASPE